MLARGLKHRYWDLNIFDEDVGEIIERLENIKREAEEEGFSTPKFDVCFSEDYCDMSMRCYREENDEEYEARKAEQEGYAARAKERRLSEFLKLKEEFEPDEKQLGELA